MKLTREEALNRVKESVYPGGYEASPLFLQGAICDLLLSVQAETERRVVEKCCEIAEAERNDWTRQKSSSVACISAASIRNKIRAAFPEEVPR